jgi:hypothetical protein
MKTIAAIIFIGSFVASGLLLSVSPIYADEVSTSGSQEATLNGESVVVDGGYTPGNSGKPPGGGGGSGEVCWDAVATDLDTHQRYPGKTCYKGGRPTRAYAYNTRPGTNGTTCAFLGLGPGASGGAVSKGKTGSKFGFVPCYEPTTPKRWVDLDNCVVRQQGVYNGDSFRMWDIGDGSNCLPSALQGSYNIPCGYGYVWLKNTFRKGNIKDNYLPVNPPCNRAEPTPLPSERETLTINAESSAGVPNALIDLTAPDVVPVGGAIRKSAISAKRAGTTCTYRRFIDNVLVEENVRSSCNRGSPLGPLALRETKFDYDLTLAPVGDISVCASKSEFGCYYYAEVPVKQGNKQSTVVDAYRATSPGQGIQVTIANPIFEYVWYDLFRGPGVRNCVWGVLNNGKETQKTCTNILSPVTVTETPGSLVPGVSTPNKIIPIVGAVPTPIAGRNN